MNPAFRKMVEELERSHKKLLAMKPIGDRYERRPGNEESGVYLFTERGKHLYVGRTKNIRERYTGHIWASKKATFAFILARKQTGQTKASYRADSKSRTELMKNPDFKEAFDCARARIKKMDFRYVEEPDPTKQALLEIYCAVALKTRYNNFKTH